MYSRYRGGLFEAVRQLSLSLEATGVRAEVLSIEEQSLPPEKQSWEPLTYHVMNTRWPHSLGYSTGQKAFLERNQPDILHTHGIWRYASHVVNRYCRKRNVPYVVSPHGMLDPWAAQNSAWKKHVALAAYERRHLEEAACIRALCQAEARAIRQFGLRNPICVIPNGIDLPAGATDAGCRVSASEKHKEPVTGNPPWTSRVEPGQKVLLYLGRIHPKKGLVNLLRAWKAVQRSEARSQKSAEWVLVIAGWDQGGHENELKQQCDEHGLSFSDVRSRNAGSTNQKSNFSFSEFQLSAFSPSVVFVGSQFGDSKAACYQHCDAFILPSLSEGLPLVVLEAWSYGLPVMMTEACNLPEGFAANAALRIEPSEESIARGLDTLFRSSFADLQSTGSRGRALVAERFAWPKIATEMKSVYKWLLGGGTAPDCVLVN